MNRRVLALTVTVVGVALISLGVVWGVGSRQAGVPLKDVAENAEPSCVITPSRSEMREIWARSSEYRATGVSFLDLVREAFGVAPSQIIVKVTLPKGVFDVRLNVPEEGGTVRETLQRSLEQHFQMRLRRVSATKDVYVLRAPEGRPAALHNPSSGGRASVSGMERQSFRNVPMGFLASELAGLLSHPVIDETQLKDAYDFDFVRPLGKPEADAVVGTVRAQLGLTLTMEKRATKAIVIESPESAP